MLCLDPLHEIGRRKMIQEAIASLESSDRIVAGCRRREIADFQAIPLLTVTTTLPI